MNQLTLIALKEHDHSPVECNTDLCQKDLQVLSTQVLLRRVPNFFEAFATRYAWLGIHPCERQVVVPRLEIITLLLRQLKGQPVDDCCEQTGEYIIWTSLGNNDNNLVPSTVR